MAQLEALDEVDGTNEKNEFAFLERLLKYTKYLYEEETERSIRLNAIVKVYLTIQTFTLGAVGFKIIDTIQDSQVLLASIATVFHSHTFLPYAALSSGILLVASLLLSVMVLDMRKYERLCEPEHFVERSGAFSDEKRLVAAMVSNYVIASKRNFHVGQRKAVYLKASLYTYVFSVSLLLFLVCYATMEIT